MKTLIVGGGFIGNATAEYAKSKGDLVRVLAPPKHDIRDSDKWDLTGFDLIMIYAAKTSELDFEQGPEGWDVNVDGLEKLARQCNLNQKVMFASSGAVYGNGRDMVETASCVPISRYGMSKLKGESIMRGATIVRFFNVYGPGEEHKGRSKSIVAQFIEQASKGKVVIYGDGQQSRDFVHIKDAARIAYELSIQGPGIFNVGTGTSTSYMGLLELIQKRFAFEIEYVKNRVNGYQLYTKADIRKITALGLKPEISLEDGIRELIARHP